MTDSFGKADDDQDGQGKNFGENDGTGTTGDQQTQGIDAAAYEALQIRDAAAQLHIPKLQSENSELRDKVTELQASLANATTIDDALDKMSAQGDSQPTVDRTDVAQIVEEVLGTKQTQARQEANWSTVQNKLTEVYSDWKTADAKVQERCQELDVSLQDATEMARHNPKAFMQLFVPSAPSSADRSSGTGDLGQRGVSSAPDGQLGTKEYYSKLRKTDPEKYWSVDVQAQMRRDLF